MSRTIDSSSPSASTPAAASTQDLLRFERLMSGLSATFINLPAHEMDRAIEASLARIVAALRIDRSSLARMHPLTGQFEITHSYAANGVAPVPELALREVAPWGLRMLMANKPIVFSHIDDLPAEASVDKESYRSIDLKSHVTMPIVVGGQLHGCLSFGSVRAERCWPDDLLNRLRLLAEVFGSALARKRAQEELDLAIGFERLASSILASLVLARPGGGTSAISLGLRQIGEFMGADRVALWQRVDGSTNFRATQHWDAEGFIAPITSNPASELPWISARIASGKVLRLARLAELAPEAAIDSETLRAVGIRSLLVVPISVFGKNAGALSIASAHREQDWPDALTPGVSLLSEVFAALHAREATEHRKQAAEVEAAHWRERLAHLVRVHTAGEMSVALAHEITQPLGAIENYALAARRRAGEASPDLARVVDLLDKVVGQATRAGDVVTRMRSMAQRHELEPKPIDVGRSVAECIGMVKMDCELRDIRILLKAASGLPVVVVDEIHLQQVILNLLRNAMEAIELAPACGAREIAVGIGLNERDEVLVEVADRGVGIADGHLERVFESFYSTKSSGLGVGLAICRKLIEAHGGALWASHNAGGGARLQFTLPIAAPGE